MAVGTATAKLIAQLVAKKLKQLTDEEERRKMLIIILVPTISVLLLLTFIVYILTSPISLLLGFLMPDEVSIIKDFQIENGYYHEEDEQGNGDMSITEGTIGNDEYDDSADNEQKGGDTTPTEGIICDYYNGYD